MPPRPGIYLILNLLTRDFYVGSSVDMSARTRDHFWRLRQQKHPNPRLQRAWNKYGPRFFKPLVLEEVGDEAELLTREQHHLDTLSPKYNILADAGKPPSRAGYTYDREAQIKYSLANTSRKRVLSPDGLYFWSIKEASRSTGIPESTLRYRLKDLKSDWEYA